MKWEMLLLGAQPLHSPIIEILHRIEAGWVKAKHPIINGVSFALEHNSGVFQTWRIYMFDMNQFDRLLAQAVNEQHGHGRTISHSLGEFFRYAQTSTSYLNGRQSYYSQRLDYYRQRLECEELTTQDLKATLQQLEATLQQTTNNMGILAAVQASELQTIQASKNMLEQKFERLGDHFDIIQTGLDTAVEQNVRLQSRLSELESRPTHINTILNPINWGKGQWSSFVVGLAVGEQIVEQCTPYKPVRKMVCRYAKKLVGKKSTSLNSSLPEELLPQQNQSESVEAVVSVDTTQAMAPPQGTL
jgi:hypothetical protein